MASSIRKLIPLLDRVLVKRFDPVTATKGGILIPEKAQSKVLQGQVVAVGPGGRNKEGASIPIGISVGDKVLLPEFGGTKVELEDKSEYYLFKESDILAKLE
ncbi:10 kDa heat shock protein, mitochondrial [Condylostylus longicornis]|uniref:10 kDa heat shock protein, mitochondrial n=1 Tax=Condylostylus longicornis TaxID=2530218 RepID=UPI00244E1420|nr:10 kDa heat shock protein, mitochondrial [Condylostylus longicornis]